MLLVRIPMYEALPKHVPGRIRTGAAPYLRVRCLLLPAVLRMPSTRILTVSDLLAPGRVSVGLPGRSKETILDAVIDLLAGSEAVVDLDQFRADVFAREALMSTGVGKGLALPHARSKAVRDTVAAFAVTADPVEYRALDGEPVRLVFLLCGPEDERGSHITLLSRVSRLMNDEAFRDQLLAAPNVAAVLNAFREAEDQIG